MGALTTKINAYVAILFITIVGAGAALFIIRVAHADHTGSLAEEGTASSYQDLQDSILRP